MSDALYRLGEAFESHKFTNGGDLEKSYIAHLSNEGDDAILKKIGEEAAETVMAAKDVRVVGMTVEAYNKVVYEVADLWFHTMVLLSHLDLAPDDVVSELAHREGLSGLEKKALHKSQARDTADD